MKLKPTEALTPADYQALARQLGEKPKGRALSVALLSSNSFAFLQPYLVVECARRGIAASPRCSEFGQLEQALLDDANSIVDADTDVVVLALRVEDIAANALARAAPGRYAPIVDDCVERALRCVELVRKRSAAKILLANFSLTATDSRTMPFDAGLEHGLSSALLHANIRLNEALAAVSGATVWDYNGLVASRGASGWTDPRLWYLARQPIASGNLPFAASHLARTIAGTVFPPCKCLVLDLDNTLWGGAAGDDGLAGIQLGDDYPGNVFKAFQRVVAGLREQGVLLAVASKNDPEVARHVLDEHPDQLLRWSDFSSHQVGWGAKSDSLRQIAADLNLGLDALVFFDDNAVEREEVRQQVPEVQVIEVPESPLGFIDALLSTGCFDSPFVSVEDQQRADYYANEARRQESRASHTSMEDFLASLEMQALVGNVADDTIARVAQLVGKTNQFNLTTRRHSQPELLEMGDDPMWDVRWLRLSDRYGDSGLVGVVVLHYEDSIATIDTFLMSCRVMNRRVEVAMLCDAIECARARGCTAIRGEYRATERNSIVAEFFTENGFVALDEGCVYEARLADEEALPTWPDFIAPQL